MPLLEELEVPAAEEDIPGREDGPPTDDDDTTGALLEFPAWEDAPTDDAGALLLPFREEEELTREDAVVLLAPVEEEPAVLEEPAALDAPPPDDEELVSCGSPVEPHPTANAATSPGKPTRIRMDNLPGSGMWGMGGTPSIAQCLQRVCCQPGLRDAQRTDSETHTRQPCRLRLLRSGAANRPYTARPLVATRKARVLPSAGSRGRLSPTGPRGLVDVVTGARAVQVAPEEEHAQRAAADGGDGVLLGLGARHGGPGF